MIKIEYNGIRIECETAEQTEAIVKALKDREGLTNAPNHDLSPYMPHPITPTAPYPQYPWNRPHYSAPTWLGYTQWMCTAIGG